jgi:glycine cleavage system H protein
VEGNAALDDAPESVNQDPYGEGWLARLKPSASLDGLLDAAGYQEVVATEE